ncbi:hypothetical protein E3P99_02266 [Wallemia hederae]|uniref:Tetrapyrrole biosynthesis uroporphyrinogen III synthase domain-containing protein n=1 Tax=Wallemia hederae TaxID=1540922 RepID=A0A4T0FQ80_9BASI|nr:hypothetical protein E3P99_02266 [Wallemia hederae]
MHAIVFKEESSNYKTALENIDISTTFIPVLDSSLVDIPALSKLLASSADAFDGVVVTSQRAVEAWRVAATAVQDVSEQHWSNLPFYSVGPSTSSALQSLSHSLTPPFSPKHILGGEESGNGAKLADYILSHEGSTQRSHGTRRILYLVGDKTASELSSILEANNVYVERRLVYATQPITAENVERRIQESDSTSADWIVVFSPSGANVIVPAIKRLGMAAKVASIGQTTSRRLQELYVSVDAVPAKPDAQLLADAIRESMAV